MCGNNCNVCNWFSGNNWWWIIILLLLFCNCGGNTFGGNGCGNGCGSNCGSNWNGCGCDNDRCC